MCALLADARRDRIRVGALDAESLRHAWQHEGRIAKGRERHEQRAALGVLRQQARELEREAGLPDAAGAEDRDHARVVLEHGRHGVEELLLPAEKPRGRHGEVDTTRGAQRRESAVPQLVQSRRAVEVLEPV